MPLLASHDEKLAGGKTLAILKRRPPRGKSGEVSTSSWTDGAEFDRGKGGSSGSREELFITDCEDLSAGEVNTKSESFLRAAILCIELEDFVGSSSTSGLSLSPSFDSCRTIEPDGRGEHGVEKKSSCNGKYIEPRRERGIIESSSTGSESWS